MLATIIQTMKKIIYLLFSVVLVMSSCTTTKTVKTTKTQVPPGQAKKTSTVPPGQMKKATGSQSAAPYAPGQQKKSSPAKKKS